GRGVRSFCMEESTHCDGLYSSLQLVFHKLLINFTWWINREHSDERNVFQGGFLGLDNIGVFNRSEKLPGDIQLAQSDATSWMAMYCLNMLSIALELAPRVGDYVGGATPYLQTVLLDLAG